jgi:phenylacetate-CoA ligase
MGKSYRQTIAFLSKSQYWPADRLEEYQLACLQRLLQHAYTTVPYYKQVFDRLDFDPHRVLSLGDIERLPLLSREEVAGNYGRLISSAYGSLNTYEGMTGGTTGAAVRLLFDVRSNSLEWAFLHTLWGRVGYSPCHRRIALLGTPFQGDRRLTMKYDPFHNELQLSALDMDEASLRQYVRAVLRFRPVFAYGLPSALSVFAGFLSGTRSTVGAMKAVLCASEQLDDRQVHLLEGTFGCRTYSWYGQTEKVALAGQCEYSRDYHLFSEYGYTELVDECGNVICEPGQPGEIVATGFVNYAMPLIRYRTGDMGEYAGGVCRCGRPYRRLSRLVGRRAAEYLVGRDNEKIPLAAINTQISEFRNVRQAQFVQTRPGRFRLNILATPGVSAEDAEAIRRALVAQMAGRAEVEVALVSDLVRTARGKAKPCVQALECRE